jgi:hypothetical protein
VSLAALQAAFDAARRKVWAESSMTTATSSTSPMIARARPRRSSSRPTTVASRRTCWHN